MIHLTLLATIFGLHSGFDYRYDAELNQKGHYETGVMDKMSRGMTNVAFGWTDNRLAIGAQGFCL